MDEKQQLPEDEEKKLSGLVPDIVRRAVLTGVGALFMTEEGIRNMVSEMKLPKDALAFLLSQADKTRTEVARVVTQEMRRFLESDTLRREILEAPHRRDAGGERDHPAQAVGRAGVQGEGEDEEEARGGVRRRGCVRVSPRGSSSSRRSSAGCSSGRASGGRAT